MNSLRSLLLKNFMFMVLKPGIVAGLLPYFIINGAYRMNKLSLGWPQYFGTLIFMVGLVALVSCVLGFALIGRGTLSPVCPTEKLVIAGLYKYSRNPMYVSVLLILLGEALFFTSWSLSIYLLVVFICFHLFITLREEPRLKRDFGAEYENYCTQVRRWI